MTTEAIVESGMTFGPILLGSAFLSRRVSYRAIQNGVQMAEFFAETTDIRAYCVDC